MKLLKSKIIRCRHYIAENLNRTNSMQFCWTKNSLEICKPTNYDAPSFWLLDVLGQLVVKWSNFHHYIEYPVHPTVKVYHIRDHRTVQTSRSNIFITQDEKVDRMSRVFHGITRVTQLLNRIEKELHMIRPALVLGLSLIIYQPWSSWIRILAGSGAVRSTNSFSRRHQAILNLNIYTLPATQSVHSTGKCLWYIICRL